jgi:NADH:ubiquinone oxidoreductase subunit E
LITEKTMLTEKYPNEIQAILAKYPPDQKRSAVMPLIYLAQRERLRDPCLMQEIAGLCGDHCHRGGLGRRLLLIVLR